MQVFGLGFRVLAEEAAFLDEGAEGNPEVHEGNKGDPAPEGVHQLLVQVHDGHLSTIIAVMTMGKR